MPVLRAIAVKVGSEATDSVCDVGAGTSTDIHEASHKRAIRGASHPSFNGGCNVIFLGVA